MAHSQGFSQNPPGRPRFDAGCCYRKLKRRPRRNAGGSCEVLHDLSQRAIEDRRPRARSDGRRASRRSVRDLGEGPAPVARWNDAASGRSLVRRRRSTRARPATWRASSRPAPRRAPILAQLPLAHRLTRTEYANVIRDLLALPDLPKELDYATLLPADNASSGFDNLADTLFVSPATMERYLEAALKISRVAVGDPDDGCAGEHPHHAGAAAPGRPQ